MEFSPNVYENLPSFYKNAVEKLLNNINYNSKIEDQRKFFNEFSRKFTMMPDLWNYWEKLERVADGDMTRNQSFRMHMKLRRRSYKHFYWENEMWARLPTIRDDRPILPYYFKTLNSQYLHYLEYRCKTYYCYSIKKQVELLRQSLTYPHANLKKAIKLYQEFSASPMTKDLLEQYEKSLLLYEKIKAVEENAKEWIECLKQTSDDEFVIQNFELRLGKNSCDKDFWKLFIEYLNSINHMHVLEAYRRYSRLFVEDKDLLQEYRNQIYEYISRGNDVTKYFIDTIRFEVDFGSIIDGMELLQKALNSITVYSKSFFKFAYTFGKKYGYLNVLEAVIDESKKRLMSSKTKRDLTLSNLEFVPLNFSVVSLNSTFSSFYENIQPQYFPFQSPLTVYLMKNANFIVYNKLIKTCKYFVITKKQHVLVWDLMLKCPDGDIKQTIDFSEDSLFALPDHPLLESMKKIRIGKRLKVKGWGAGKSLSNLFSKFISHDIQYLDLCCFILTLDEFKFLTASKKIEKANVDIKIIKSMDDREFAAMDDVIEQFPNAYSFNLGWVIYMSLKHLTAETTKNIADLDRNVKLKKFEISFNHLFCPLDFCEFIKKNAAVNAKWAIQILDEIFLGHIDDGYRNLVKTTIDNLLSAWNPPEERPVIDIKFW